MRYQPSGTMVWAACGAGKEGCHAPEPTGGPVTMVQDLDSGSMVTRCSACLVGATPDRSGIVVAEPVPRAEQESSPSEEAEEEPT